MVPFFLFAMSINPALAEGQRLLQEGDPEEAASVLEKALTQAPDHPHLLLYAGLARVEAALVKGRPEAGRGSIWNAAPTIESAEISHENTNAGEQAGESSVHEMPKNENSGPDIDSGMDLIRRAMDASPDNRLLAVFYARALYDCGDLAEALRQCQAVMDAQPCHSGAAALQFLCEAQNDPLAGLAGLVLAGVPDDSELLGRALCTAEKALLPTEQPAPQPLWAGGRVPWADHPGLHSAFAASLPERRSKAWLKRSEWLLQETGASERSIAAAEAAMRARPSDGTRVLLSARYFEAERYDEVEAALRGFMPDDPERNTWVGFSLYQLGHPAEALEVLAHAEADSGMAQHARGLAYLATGEPVLARRCFVRSARFDASIAEGRLARAYLHCRAEALRSE